jgi:hypothetical protein
VERIFDAQLAEEMLGALDLDLHLLRQAINVPGQETRV